MLKCIPPSCMEVAGCHALVTGGAAGIGLEVCKQLILHHVASIAILDVSRAALSTAVETLQALNSQAHCRTHVVDVTSLEQVLALLWSGAAGCFPQLLTVLLQVTRAVAQEQSVQGPLDLVFANAGIGPCGAAHFPVCQCSSCQTLAQSVLGCSPAAGRGCAAL